MPRYAFTTQGPAGTRRMGSAVFGSGVKRLLPAQHALIRTGTGRKPCAPSNIGKRKQKGRPRHTYVLY